MTLRGRTAYSFRMSSPQILLLGSYETIARDREAIARKLADVFRTIFAKLKEHKEDIAFLWAEFDNLTPDETIMGCSTKEAFCDTVLKRSYRAVCYMLAGGNHNRKEHETVSCDIPGCPGRRAMNLRGQVIEFCEWHQPLLPFPPFAVIAFPYFVPSPHFDCFPLQPVGHGTLERTSQVRPWWVGTHQHKWNVATEKFVKPPRKVAPSVMYWRGYHGSRIPSVATAAAARPTSLETHADHPTNEPRPDAGVHPIATKPHAELATVWPLPSVSF
jgi:hypothetical protein